MKPVLVFLVLVCLACSEPPPTLTEIPELDLSTMEPQVAAAIEAARRRVEEEPRSAAAWGKLGMVLHAHALFSEAVTAYRNAITIAPGDDRWPYLAARALETDDLDGALELYEAAARRAPRNPGFHVAYGDALMRAGEPARAEARYREALAMDPSSSHALVGLARIELAAGDVDAALEHLENAAAAAPYHGEVHALLAQVHQQRGETEEARRAELRARALPETSRPADPAVEAMEAEAVSSRAHTRRGVRLAREGRFAEAEAEFRRVLGIRPGNAHDYANLGGALARQGKAEEAIEAYREAIRVEPGEPSARNNLAMALADQGRLEEAAGELAEAIRLDPAHAEAHDNLGLVRYRQRRFAEAVAHHEKAIEIAPSLTDAYNHLGTALAATGRLADAMERWRQALELDERHVSALYNLSAALAQTGEHEEAITRLREGVRIAPNSSRFVSLLAWELATAPVEGLRDGAEAHALAERLVAAYPRQPSSFDLLAVALAEKGDYAAAVEAARRGVELATATGQGALARQIEERLRAYQAGRPFRQPSP